MSDSTDINIVEAHDHSSSNKQEIKSSKKCGCFFCCEIYDASDVVNFIEANNDCDRLGTAICPKCGIDSVIGDASGIEITPEFMRKMHEHWFNIT